MGVKKFKLPKNKKAKWLKALRSGEYRQCRDALQTETDEGMKYCCLGVARAIGICRVTANHGDGLVSNNFLPENIQQDLAYKNDRFVDFKRIADWIERNL